MLNNLLSILIKNRIKLIKKAIQNPIRHQNKILNHNIDFSKQTLFGQKHAFIKINI